MWLADEMHRELAAVIGARSFILRMNAGMYDIGYRNIVDRTEVMQ